MSNLDYLKNSIELLEKKIETLIKLLKENMSYNNEVLSLLKTISKPPTSGTQDLKISIDSLTEQFSQIKTERKISTVKTKNFLTYNSEEVKKHLKL